MSEGTRIAATAVGVDRRARRRRFALRGIAASGGLVLLSTVVFGLTLNVAFFAAAVLAGLMGLSSFLALVIVNAGGAPRLSPQELSVEGDTLRLPGRAVPLTDVTQGWWEDPDLVHLALKSGEVLVVKVDRGGGERLLRAAGVTAAERVLRVPLASAASQIPGGSVFGGALLAVFGAALFMAFVTLAYGIREMVQYLSAREIGGSSILVTVISLLAFAVYAIASALQRREVVVGTDGVAYQKTLATEFIPYSHIARVLPDTRGVRLLRKDGRRLLLPTRGGGGRPLPLAPQASAPRTPAEAQRRVLFERIVAAMASGGGSAVAQVALDRLDRNGRSREAWRDALQTLLGAEGDYRNAGVSPEDLGSVIEDPAAPAERRVAATVALAAREGSEARRRVRLAVQACADQDLQAALEAAAEGEIDEAMLGRAAARRV